MLSVIFHPLATLLVNLVRRQPKKAKPEVTIKKIAKVTKTIKGPYLRGRVKFKDRYFHAFCQDSIEILRGTHVEVVEIKGTFLIVKPLSPP
jgi:membrane protein implicated in regulation of membrane protease activity